MQLPFIKLSTEAVDKYVEKNSNKLSKAAIPAGNF